MAIAEILSRIAAELALFAGVGFLLFAVNDLVVDIIYFTRAMWRALAVYTRYPRAFASELPDSAEPGFFALLVPAWDEASVIASMLKATSAGSIIPITGYSSAIIATIRRPRPRLQASRTRESRRLGRGGRADDQGRLPQPSVRRADRL